METGRRWPCSTSCWRIRPQSRFEYRHRWKTGDTVIWDNRCLLHKANGDYPVAQVRYLYRLMLKGEKPV